MTEQEKEIIKKLGWHFPNRQFEIQLTARRDGSPWKTIICDGAPLKTGWNPEQAQDASVIHGKAYEEDLKESIVMAAVKELQLRGF